ncbi:MAG: DUF58 domain-containing protein [Bacillota bacterium]
MNKKIVTAFTLLVISIIFALLVGGKIPYLIFHALILYLLLPLAHSALALVFISGTVEVGSGEFFPGDVVNIRYLIRNSSFISFPYIIFSPDLSKDLGDSNLNHIPLSLKKKEIFSTTESPLIRRRGFYRVGGFHITIKDVFGLYSFNKYIQSYISLVVFPELIQLSSFRIPVGMQLGELYITDNSYRDKSRISSLREYRDGDSIRTIHWKATSKKDIPVVKEFETRGDTNVEIFMDSYTAVYKNDQDRRLEDKVVEVATSIVHYCLVRNISVSLNYENNSKINRLEGREYNQFKPFLKSFAMYTGSGKARLSQLLETQIDKIRKGSSTILITPCLDSFSASAAMELDYKGLNPVVISISDRMSHSGYRDNQVVGRLREDKIPVFIIDSSQSIAEVLEVHYD